MLRLFGLNRSPTPRPEHEPGRASELAEAVRARLPRLLANAAQHSGPPPGVQVAYAEHGRVLYAEAFGLSDAAIGTPLTIHHAFTLASQSKPVAAVVAMRLAEAGLIDLDEPLLARVRHWRPSNEQLCGLNADAATIRHALSHTSGWDLRSLPMHPTDHAATAPRLEDLLSGIAGPQYTPRMRSAPDTSRLYSGAAYTMLQLALEAATGEPYAALVDRLVARPLGWSGTWAGWDPSRLGRLAGGHGPTPNPRPVERAFYPALASSGLFGTASDLASLWSAVASIALGSTSTPDLLSPVSARGMLSPVPVPGDGIEFGLGFALTPWADLTVFKHAGWCPGFWGTTEGLAELGVAASVQCNMSEPAGKFVAQRLCGFVLERARALHGVPAPPPAAR